MQPSPRPARCSGSRASTHGMSSSCGSSRARSTRGAAVRRSGRARLEVELPPRRPPVLGPRGDLPGSQHLDPVPMAVRLDEVRLRVLDENLARTAGIVGSHRTTVLDGTAGTVLDQLAGADGGHVPRAEASETLL